MAVTTATAILIGTAIASTAAIGSSMYASTQEKKSQKSMLQAAQDKERAAEEAAKNAEKLASEQAMEDIKKRRRAQTQTILTSPLGAGVIGSGQPKTLLGQ